MGDFSICCLAESGGHVTATAPAPPELPRGGRRLFPRYRVVGFYGTQRIDALGAGPPEAAGDRDGHRPPV